ncbi:MAG: metallophosphoesterase [Ignavibacteriales bacterium]|nr:metallophosphoesterase [Ignavibacteriales bacterium]
MYKVLFFLLLSVGFINAQNFSFIAMSDSRGTDNGVNSEVLSALVNHAVKNQPDAKFVLFPGDLVDGSKTDPQSTISQLNRWKEVMQPFYNNPNMVAPKIWLTVGNHEIQHRDDEANFRKLFPEILLNGPEEEKGLTYSFDFDSCHFVFVTSDKWYYGNPEDTTDDRRDWQYINNLDWLENDLISAQERGTKYTFIMTHEPVFPTGGHLRDALPNLGKNFTLPADTSKLFHYKQRNKYWDLCKKYKVTAHICGHEHLYDRLSVDGIYQIVAGSSGAPLYNFNPKYGEVLSPDEGGFELSYEQAIPYYDFLGYQHGPGKNSQISEDFKGLKAFEYVVFKVQADRISVDTWGAFPKPKSFDTMQPEIKLIDSFIIMRYE